MILQGENRAYHSSKLDVLRVVLCGCVLLCHFYPGCHALSGNVGVLGFFVLSGYLLQASFHRTGNCFDVERFYAGKIRKLLPAFLLSIALSLIIPAISLLRYGEFPVLPAEEDTYSLFRYIWHYNIVVWYLGCLFVFILLAPFLWFLNKVRGAMLLCFACSFVFAAFLYCRHDGTSAVLMGYEGSMCTCPQVRLWQFVAGMIANLCFYRFSRRMRRETRRRLSICLLLALAVLFLVVSMHFRRGYDFPNTFIFDVPAVIMLALLIVLWDDGAAFVSPGGSQLFEKLASLTYGIYLFHLPVRKMIALAVGGMEVAFIPHSVYAAAYGVLAVVIAAALADIVNRMVSRYAR